MFFEPERSQFDLHFRLFDIDVRVHPWFWIISAIMGWSWLDLGFEYLATWIACVFVSVLIHELGHVFAGRLFGTHGHIVLYSFGGLAVGSSALRSRWQRILVYFAGPLAGFLLYGFVWWTTRHLSGLDDRPLLGAALRSLLVINLFWGVMNLLPIWPLDGGQISRDVLGWFQADQGVRVSLGISLVVAGLAAFIALLNTYSTRRLPPYVSWLRGFYVVLLFACLAFNSYQALQVENRRRPWDREWD